jgi:hypothetical protein
MGNGSGPGGLNSRVYTNSYSSKVVAMAFPYKNGGSFGGLSKPQYSYNTYHNLAYNGAGAGGRAGRWAVAHNKVISFNPPAPLVYSRAYSY